MSPEEFRAKELHYRKLWRDNEKAKMDLRRMGRELIIDMQCDVADSFSQLKFYFYQYMQRHWTIKEKKMTKKWN